MYAVHNAYHNFLQKLIQPTPSPYHAVYLIEATHYPTPKRFTLTTQKDLSLLGIVVNGAPRQKARRLEKGEQKAQKSDKARKEARNQKARSFHFKSIKAHFFHQALIKAHITQLFSEFFFFLA